MGRSFFRRMRRGDFDLANRDALWALLVTITLNKANGVDATNGAEQPVWDPGTGKFYLSIPELGGPGGSGGGSVAFSIIIYGPTVKDNAA